MFREIFIPSRGRPDDVVIWRALPKSIRDRCHVVVRRDEYDAYATHADGGMKFVVLPEGVEGLSPTRQWILENAEERCHLQLDDDLTSIGVKRAVSKMGGIRAASPSQIESCFELLHSWLKQRDAVQVGLSNRMTSAFPHDEAWTPRWHMSKVLGYDRVALLDHGFRFDNFPLFQDLDMNLQILTARLPSRISFKYSRNNRDEGFRGGCQLYRTDALKKKVGAALEKKYPGVVRLDILENGYVALKISWRKLK